MREARQIREVRLKREAPEIRAASPKKIQKVAYCLFLFLLKEAQTKTLSFLERGFYLVLWVHPKIQHFLVKKQGPF